MGKFFSSKMASRCDEDYPDIAWNKFTTRNILQDINLVNLECL